MPLCSVCQHPDKEAIDKALIAGESPRAIVSRFVTHGGTLGRMAVQRHKDNHLPETLMKSTEAAEISHADDLLRQLRSDLERVRLLSDACDRWLRDPDDPTRYNIGPRSEDVNVTYEEEVGTEDRPRTIRKTAPLSELLARIEGRYIVTAVETKHADPRELLLKAWDRLQKSLDFTARLLGEIDDRPQLNVTLSPQWVEIRTVFIQALEPYPEARQAVARALMEVDQGK